MAADANCSGKQSCSKIRGAILVACLTFLFLVLFPPWDQASKTGNRIAINGSSLVYSWIWSTPPVAPDRFSIPGDRYCVLFPLLIGRIAVIVPTITILFVVIMLIPNWIARKAVLVTTGAVLVLAVTAWVLIWQDAYKHGAAEACSDNLDEIKAAKERCELELHLKAGDAIPEDAYRKALAPPGNAMPVFKCRSGGTYIIGPVGADPKCTYTNVIHAWVSRDGFPWIKRVEIRHSLVHSSGYSVSNGLSAKSR